MLYLDKLTLHNFKSFRHANVKFSSGFNCVVGPNGSGKSNLCDSLLFVLGESSLRRMRSTTTAGLINNAAKPDPDLHVKRGYVTLNFIDGTGASTEVSRIVRSNNKIAYRLNSKKVPRQALLDMLHANNCWVNETNTITQGEITRILNFTPKERRGLLDLAAGIREFDDKKDNALKELEKVEERMSNSRVMLSEREGFLNELKKEKDDAERYNSLSESIRQMTYTLLKRKEEQVAEEYAAALDKLRKAEERKKELQAKLFGIDTEIEKLTSERTQKSQQLNERSMEVNTTSKTLDELNSTMASSKAQLEALERESNLLKERMELMRSERKKIKAQSSANAAELQAQAAQLEDKLASLKNYDLDVKEVGEAIALYEEHQRKVDAIGEEEEVLAQRRAQALSKQKVLESESRAANDELALRTKELEIQKAAITKLEKAKSAATVGLADGRKELMAALSEEPKLKEERLKIDEQNIQVREALAQYGGSQDRAAGALKDAIMTGLHGRAYELCSFDDKYTNAISAAAGSRLNYFVVDSVETAKKAISVLKAKDLGRSSFIPMKELKVQGTQAGKGLVPLMSIVSFDKKFEKAFEYVFSNTYIVDSIDDAQKAGIGSHRFVTIDGELIESSGIITGGRMKAMQFPGKLQAELRRLAEEKTRVESVSASLALKVESAKKAVAAAEMALLNHELELKHALEAQASASASIDSLKPRLSLLSASMLEVQKDINSAEAKIKDAARRKEQAQVSRDALHEMVKAPDAQQRKAAHAESAGRVKELRTAIEELKMRGAELKKENEMLAERDADIEAEAEKAQSDASEASNNANALRKKLDGFALQKKEMEKKIKSHDDMSSSLYKELSAIDKKVADTGFERGKLSSEQERLSRDSMMAEAAKMQSETRLTDIKAELASYKECPTVGGATEELDRRLTIAKNDIESLGSVNLKAPEMYETRRRDVEDAEAKLRILDNERNSIMSMINEIESKKLAVFMGTFRVVNDNFRQLYSYIFDGEASLSLENPKEPFNSGLKISIQDKFKKSADQLSGGEKSLLILILIFAIQMRNPMSFYVFDEIDVALDKENSKKLSMLIKQMSSRSQFIVVSHNDTLISAADTALGVAKQDGESKIVGVQLVGTQTDKGQEPKGRGKRA